MEITATAVEATDTDLAGTRYVMIDEGAEIGYLFAHTSGLILNVEVDEDRQGEGFAQAMGGDVMDDERAAAIVGMDLSIYETD
ncbi:hypothetical protein [Actinomyces israelii]